MKIRLMVLLCLLVGLAGGCALARKVPGEQVRISGVVRDRFAGDGVAGLPVLVTGSVFKGVIVQSPLSSTTTDSEGRFDFTVSAAHTSYEIVVRHGGHLAKKRLRWSDLKDGSQIEILWTEKKPNQAPEPTSGLRPAAAHL